jgi:hypothetical protein
VTDKHTPGALRLGSDGPPLPPSDRSGRLALLSHTDEDGFGRERHRPMLPRVDMNPEATARALDALAAELQRDPASLASLPELEPTRLADAAESVRLWAAEHDVPAACVPEQPTEAELTVPRTVVFLTDLAAVIRHLDSYIRLLDSMKQVITRLGAGEHAAGELEALDDAMNQLLVVLLGAERMANTLRAALAGLTSRETRIEELLTLHEEADRLHATLEQLVASSREICNGVKAWGLRGQRQSSNPP